MKAGKDISGLLAIMARLRSPDGGCPWDLVQSFATIAPYTIEEAYEVADAIERNDFEDLKDELGDLLLQVVFHAQMAKEAGYFEFGDVVEAISAKMVRRHPHVFGEVDASDATDVKRNWDAIKAEEKLERARRRPPSGPTDHGLLDEVPTGLAPLLRAIKLQRRAGSVGFDWNDPRAVLTKIREEVDEIEQELSEATPQERLEDEVGDLLFAVANLARHLAVDPDKALRHANAKFVRRFRYIETELLRSGRRLGQVSLDEMEALWGEAKRLEAKI